MQTYTCRIVILCGVWEPTKVDIAGYEWFHWPEWQDSGDTLWNKEGHKPRRQDNWQVHQSKCIYVELLLRNLYAGQEATVRTGRGTTDWFQIGKGVHKGCILPPCFFNLYTQYSMQTAGLEETQAGNSHTGWMHRGKIVYLH